MRLDAFDGIFDRPADADSHAWGTVSGKDGNIASVVLDGASRTTPCVCLDNCLVGDRVLVVIRNGTCIAVGPIGSPRGMWATAYGCDAMDLTNDASIETGNIVMKNIVGSARHGFELVEGGLKCPSRGNVVVNAVVQLGTGFTSNDLVHIRLVKNNGHTGPDIVDRVVSTSYGTRQITTFVSVVKGDLIKARVYNQTAARGTTNANSTTTRISVAYL